MIRAKHPTRAALLALLLAAGSVVVACDGEDPAPHAPPPDRTDVDAPAGYDPALAEAMDPAPAPDTVVEELVEPGAERSPESPGAETSPPATSRPGASRPAEVEPGPDASSPDASSSTDALLRATARRYEQVRSLRAEFEQELRNPLMGTATRSSGTLFQRQPDRFLMRFSDPDGDVIVSDGRHFWLYYPSVDARQVIRAPRGPQGLDLRSQFIGDPVSRFRATDHGREAVRGRAARVLTLVPREPQGYRELKVWIDLEDHLVRRFELLEDNGVVRRFELRDVVINPTLPDRLFEFTPPEGAQVIQRG